MLKVVVFIFVELAQRAYFCLTLDYKDFVNPTGYGS
jgi:hypothetical protein